ncbi:apolipoprotein N-acyltransferase [Gallibacterium sp. AGMB14963]|uniref:apolipoprotein N-acyltransferase n=1 Tax=Gallibacterium faecale TaxID=3019086 RepID=UPI0022F186DA|nr:apolipoprotein N-acyltransferase [Gallibacterium sp. AGMB14963]MDA3978500.1 apolipoprotein N-acyltransferase [Gallibacterium sp. AGMB14963]
MPQYLFPLFSILGGILGVFAYAPFNYSFLAFISLFILLACIKYSKTTKQALLSAFLWGLSYFTFGLNWIHISISQFGGLSLPVAYILVVLLAAYLALFPTVFTYLIRKLHISQSILFAILWTFTEFLRGWLFSGFPWLQFGYTQIDTFFAGIAPFFGVQGITFVMIWLSALVLNVIDSLFSKQPRHLLLISSQSLLAIVLIALSYYSQQISFIKQNTAEKPLTITLVQGNIEQQYKWDPDYIYQSLDIHKNLLEPHLGKSDIIILPESVLPLLENQLEPYIAMLSRFSQQSNTAILLGTIYQKPNTDQLFNSLIALNPEQPYTIDSAPRYLKHHLVPFGEYIPLPFVKELFNIPFSDMSEGSYTQAPLTVKGANFANAICYEIIFDRQVQHNVQNNSDFILTVSNDAWFGTSIGPWQHFQMARMRALELGKPLIRDTNTGVTAFIDAHGKIISQAPQFKPTTLTAKIYQTIGKTPFSVFGNTPLYLLSIILLVLHLLVSFAGKVLLRKVQHPNNKE